MILGVSGDTSVIAQKYIEMYAAMGDVDVVTRRNPRDLPVGCDDYLICNGSLYGSKIPDLTQEQIDEVNRVNYSDIAIACDIIFDSNPLAKICIVGSISGEQGSYDMAYAGAKAALHLYVRTKRLKHPAQNLVCVAPWFIQDAKMTTKRPDFGQMLERGKKRRVGRWALSREVARIARFAMNEHLLCNTVIEAKGGVW
jgi:NAD(P)-dependent dehydrogenase (short-subunit alcohol dehydrogenase family)